MHSRGEGKVSKHAGTKNQTIVSGENHSHHAHAHAHTNTRIHDFFKKKDHGSSTGELATVSSPNEIAPHGTKSTDSLEKEHGNSSNSDMELSAAGSVGTNFSSGKGRDRTQGGPTSSSTSTVQLEELERRCQELERSCKDKDEQLKAVSNNRTILHTALQRSLNAREKELESIKAERERDRQERAVVLENLVRLNATREAKELREKLALDGARLGRIVYARAGMRSVETWEDGHASKQIHDRIDVLKKKRARVEERYRKATKIANIIFSKDGETTSGDAESEDNVICGIHVETKLDAIEALESAKFHLSNVVRKEKELRAEEDSLNDEKTAHIRALKRVASEDASRFRSRPKVRQQGLVFLAYECATLLTHLTLSPLSQLHDRYVLCSLLGKGGFSEVWRAYDLVDLKEVAVKIHQLDPRWSDSKKENYTKHVSREYEIHRNVRHPRIVSLFDVFEIDNNSFATVLECCDGSDLDTLLKERRQLPEKDARAILLQILLGMKYLSQPSEDGRRQGIIHYDLKPGNILFDEFGDAKITDFGLSKIVDAHDSAESMELTSQGAGTYWYLPPECFLFEDTVRISSKVDVWSIGVIFFQMLFGKRPFGDGKSQDKLLSDHTMLNARQVVFPTKPTVSDECKEFIQTCLTYEQSDRPTIAQLCENPYVLSNDLK